MKRKTYIISTISSMAFTLGAMYYIMTKFLLLPNNAVAIIMILTTVLIIPIVISAIIQGLRNYSDSEKRMHIPKLIIKEILKLSFIGILTATIGLLALWAIIHYENKYIGILGCLIATMSAVYLYKQSNKFKEKVKTIEDA